MESDALVMDRPAVATALVALVAALVYVGLQLVMEGSVSVAETAAFVVIFTVIYVGGIVLLERREDEAEGE